MANQKCNPAQIKVHRCVSVLPNDYSQLENLPTINGKKIIGELDLTDIGVLSSSLDQYESGSVSGDGKFLLVLDEDGVKKVSADEVKGGDGAHQAKTRQELPPIGQTNGVYFVIDENATYRWDDEQLRYIPCGRDYTEIQIINGGNAE